VSEQILMAKGELIAIGRQIAAKGLVIGPGGNISMRAGETMVISASGSSFESSRADDFVCVDIESGMAEEGAKRPSSEVLMHLECYRRRPDISAVVHTLIPPGRLRSPAPA
jgi:L-fuculose-phosphate aldolase